MTEELTQQQALQSQIICFLTEHAVLWDDAAGDGEKVDIVETHGATVLLGPGKALKLKKPVLYDHMDFSIPEKRRFFCERELSFNKRGAPDLYDTLLTISRTEDGALNLRDEGVAVDYLVRMQRFAPEAQLDQLAENTGLSGKLLDQLADRIASYHQTADVIEDHSEIPPFSSVIDQNFIQMDRFCPDLLDLEEVQAFRESLHNTAKALSSQLEKRRIDGWIRRGHGDLHLQNICLLEDGPVLFDAIEYQDDFAIGDVLYDLAFLLMDLWERGFRQEAGRVLNRYLLKMDWMKTPEALQALALLPFFLAMRAGIRTHVAANRYFQSALPEEKRLFADRTRQLFKSAQSYLSPSAPRLVAIGGFSGSGKSTLAGLLASHIAPPPGAVRLRSDEVRRQLIGWDDYSPMPQNAYTPEMSEKTYRLIEQSALTLLQAGHSVIMDAVLDRPEDQAAIEQIARTAGISFQGIWLDVTKDVMVHRIESRKNDASDATVSVLEQQLAKGNKKNSSWNVIDGNNSRESVLQRAREILAKS